MPFKISVQTDYRRAEAALSALARQQLPFATAAALTDTAIEARNQITAALPRIFDRPVPYTINAIGFRSANKASLVAQVFVKDQQAKYLLLEETGGTRTPQGNSRKPGAAFTTPGKIALDAYGNIPNGTIAKLSALSKAVSSAISAGKTRASLPVFGKRGVAEKTKNSLERRRSAQASKITGKKGGGGDIAYLKGAGPHDRGPGGFFQRLPGGKIVRLTSFESVAHYRPVLRFEERVRMIARQTFRVALVRRLREARVTAR